MAKTPEKLKELAQQIKTSGKSRQVKVRTLLSWFGAQRRGSQVVREVRSALKRTKLVAQPDFEQAYIDGKVSLRAASVPTVSRSAQKNEQSATPAAVVPGEEIAPVPTEEIALVSEDYSDPVPRIEMLDAANRRPTCVTRDSKVREAITKMLMNDFSQLPVTQNERDVDGLVSWKSIGEATVANKKCEFVRECMDRNVEILRKSTPLLKAVQVIAERDIVLVKDNTNRIVGLVTATDISLQFRALAEPFLLLKEIENHIRALIVRAKYSLEVLVKAKDPTDDRKISGVSDLTFGEYLRLFEDRENWNSIGYNLSRTSFLETLHKIRRIRNDVMHFHPDGISNQDLGILRDAVKFLQSLQVAKG
jgi:CBS domain-containing protein